MTESGVAELNSSLGFTTSFIDGELIAGGVDYSMEKIVLPITFIVFLILLIVVYACEKTHDEIEELKRRHGHGSKTRVSPGIEMHKVDNQCETENHKGDKDIRIRDDSQKHQQFSADSSDSSCDDVDSPGLNPESKYNDSVYGHHGHVPRIGLPTGPTPYAYPRRPVKVKNLEESPPPGYDEPQQNAIPVQDPPSQKQTVEKPPLLESVVGPPAIQHTTPAKQSPAPTKRLPPLIAVNNSDAVEQLNGVHQPMQAAPVRTRGHRQKPDKATPNGDQAPAEEISQPVLKDTPPSDREMFVELQTNASKSPNSEVREAPKKKHKKHKKKKHNTGEEEEEELCGDDEMLQKRKKHRKKKKKKHRHRHSDEDDDEN
ncbi:uncharacterized protein LOC117109934 [Anneissia japonica]|uniref:uncharacterized protein LOC117109934 n=1 Tax=Anneissia japonica TaxID=1529436 RepID=UPI0014255F98|nr:uncharacterized protein LOC117109934 [Anneissia japonica]